MKNINNDSWIEIYVKAITKATNDGYIEFIMQYNDKYYYCYWENKKWNNRLINFFKED